LGHGEHGPLPEPDVSQNIFYVERMKDFATDKNGSTLSREKFC
jgi:hypothetical protein